MCYSSDVIWFKRIKFCFLFIFFIYFFFFLSFFFLFWFFYFDYFSLTTSRSFICWNCSCYIFDCILAGYSQSAANIYQYSYGGVTYYWKLFWWFYIFLIFRLKTTKVADIYHYRQLLWDYRQFKTSLTAFTCFFCILAGNSKNC